MSSDSLITLFIAGFSNIEAEDAAGVELLLLRLSCCCCNRSRNFDNDDENLNRFGANCVVALKPDQSTPSLHSFVYYLKLDELEGFFEDEETSLLVRRCFFWTIFISWEINKSIIIDVITRIASQISSTCNTLNYLRITIEFKEAESCYCIYVSIIWFSRTYTTTTNCVSIKQPPHSRKIIKSNE